MQIKAVEKSERGAVDEESGEITAGQAQSCKLCERREEERTWGEGRVRERRRTRLLASASHWTLSGSESASMTSSSRVKGSSSETSRSLSQAKLRRFANGARAMLYVRCRAVREVASGLSVHHDRSTLLTVRCRREEMQPSNCGSSWRRQGCQVSAISNRRLVSAIRGSSSLMSHCSLSSDERPESAEKDESTGDGHPGKRSRWRMCMGRLERRLRAEATRDAGREGERKGGPRRMLRPKNRRRGRRTATARRELRSCSAQWQISSSLVRSQSVHRLL